MNEIEFVQFGSKGSNLYAKDDKGVVWLRVGNDEWESIEEVPRHIKQALKDLQLLQVMKLNTAKKT